MNLQQAFQHLLDNKFDNLPSDKKYLWKHRFNNNQLSIEKMTDILEKNGYKKSENWTVK